MIRRKSTLTLICLLFSLISRSQTIDSSYIIYQEQFKEVMLVRGVGNVEIKGILNEYKKNNIQSNQDFARLLGSLYSAKENIAVLLFFYSNGTLKRILFEPGKVIEEKSIAISKEALFKLSTDLNQSLNLYKMSADRAPKVRGLVVAEDNNVQKPDINKVSKKLTSILIPALFTEKYKHLIIIPCLNIGSIPFHILKPYKDGSYLIDKCSFTTTPSLIDFISVRAKLLKDYYVYNGQKPYDSLDPSLMKQNMNLVKWGLRNSLFVCNPAYPANTKYFFPDLPGAKKEIDSALLFARNYTLLSGDSAVKDSVIKYLGQSRIAYFATHGVSDVVNPQKSFLVLTGKDPFLTSREIMDLRLKAGYRAPEMVILSACQTGLGKSMEGGVSGSLARCFLIGGSRFIIMSLWNVDDDATAYLMNRFIYQMHVPSAHFPAEPLRLAILETKKKYPNPVYWASFSLIGTDF